MMRNAKAIAGNDGQLILGIFTNEEVMEKKPTPLTSFKEEIDLSNTIILSIMMSFV